MTAPIRHPLVSGKPERWSARQTVAFIVIACCSFWGGLGFLMFGGR